MSHTPRRLLTTAAALLLLCVPLGAEDPAATVRRVLDEVPLIDGHNDTPWSIRSRVNNRLTRFDFSDTSGIERPMHTDLTRLRAGGVGAQFWSVWVPTDLEGADAVQTVLEQVDLVRRLTAAYPDDFELAWSADDIRRIHAEGKIASLIGAEGGHSIGESLAVLRSLAALGVRYMTLTHWQSIPWADAATDAPAVGGLSPFGLEVVREMNRLGMLVDLSHVSAEAMHDALDASRAPVIFSHSNARALNPHPRNVPDDVLRRVADNGGVVMVNFGSFFVSAPFVERYAGSEAEEARLETLLPGDPEAREAGLDAWLDAHPMPQVTLGDLADHIDHIRNIAGIDHVGIGSDYDGVGSLPEGLEDVSTYPALLEELARRGYSEEDLAKVAGLNVLRVMESAERVALEMSSELAPSDVLLEDVDVVEHEAASSD
jgi:membrane dipeptidase